MWSLGPSCLLIPSLPVLLPAHSMKSELKIVLAWLAKGLPIVLSSFQHHRVHTSAVHCKPD